MTGMPLVFEFLLENQSKVNLQDEWGYTALTFAAKNKNRSVQVHFSISLYLSLSLIPFLLLFFFPTTVPPTPFLPHLLFSYPGVGNVALRKTQPCRLWNGSRGSCRFARLEQIITLTPIPDP